MSGRRWVGWMCLRNHARRRGKSDDAFLSLARLVSSVIPDSGRPVRLQCGARFHIPRQFLSYLTTSLTSSKHAYGKSRNDGCLPEGFWQIRAKGWWRMEMRRGERNGGLIDDDKTSLGIANTCDYIPLYAPPRLSPSPFHPREGAVVSNHPACHVSTTHSRICLTYRLISSPIFQWSA